MCQALICNRPNIGEHLRLSSQATVFNTDHGASSEGLFTCLDAYQPNGLTNYLLSKSTWQNAPYRWNDQVQIQSSTDNLRR